MLYLGNTIGAEDITYYEPKFPLNDVMRVFPVDKSITDSGGTTKTVPVLPAWTDSRLAYCKRKRVIPFLSSKVDGWAAGIAYVRNQLLAMPDWILNDAAMFVMITDRHEPEGDLGTGVTGQNAYKSNFNAFYTMIQGLPANIRAKVRCGPILTKTWTESSASGKGNFDYGLYDPGVGDWFAVDMYVSTGSASAVVTPSTLPTPAAFAATFKAYKHDASDTRPRWWPELGVIGMPDDTDGSARATWLQGLYDMVKTWKVGQSGWTMPWSFEGFIWWGQEGKATGTVATVGQRRDFPLDERTTSSTTVVKLVPPKPLDKFNALIAAQRTAEPRPAATGSTPPPADPPPPPTYTAAGAYWLGATMKKADIPAYEPLLKGNQMFRIFPNADGLPPAWNDPRFLYAQRVGAVPFCSSNIDGDSTKFAAMRTWIMNMPSWVKWLYVSDRHEPENNVKDGLTREKYLANFKAWWDACIASLPANIRVKVKAGPILTRQWIEDPNKGNGDYGLYDPMKQLGLKTDFYASDHYMDSWKPGSSANATLVADAYPDPATFLAKFKAYKAPTVGSVVDDRERLFAEWGAIGIPTDPDGSRRAAWITAVLAELDTWTTAANGWAFRGVCWWNNQGTTSPTSLTPIGTLRYFYLDKWQKDSSGAIALPGNPTAPVAAYNQAVLAHIAAQSGTGTGGNTLSAGGPAIISTTDTFTRTATEPSGATITARKWEIVSGPMGAGTQIGSAAALSWKPGTSVAGSNDIRQPTFQEMAYRLTSIAENSTFDWTTAYGYIEDIHDNRGYTGGIVGFTSATDDMLQVVRQYAIEKPGNALAGYITGLQNCATTGISAGASAAAASNLGTPFIAAWKAAAAGDPVFRKIQRDFRKSMYWDDALVQALADGVGPLGLAIYYDILVNHGPGTDSESFGGILSYVRANNTKPSSGGNQTTWLNAVTDRRNTILVSWGNTDQAVNGRVYMHRLLINGGTVDGATQAANLNLVAPFKVSCYGDLFTVSARPDPAADSLLGTYALRYTATGVGSADVAVTVSDTATSDPGGQPAPGPGTGSGGTDPIPGGSVDTSGVPVDTPAAAGLLAATYTILVTDPQLNIMGDPIHEWSYLQITLRWKEPGSGQFKVPASPYIREQLVPGCRIVVLRRVLGVQSVLISGPMEQKLREWSDTGENAGVGQYTVTFSDDMSWLAARLAYPDPALAIAAQTTDFWTYSGNPELGMLQLVRDQAGENALPARKVPKLVTAAFSGISGTGTVALGPTTDVHPRERLETLTDVLRKMATAGVGAGFQPDSLGFRTRQTQVNGQDAILFEVVRSRDLAGQVHFSRGMGNLKYYSLEEDAPTLTNVHVGGQYNKDDASAGSDKYVQEFADTETNSLAWGRFEGYLARAGSDVSAGKANDDAKNEFEDKRATARLAISAADTVDCRAMVHYGVGDLVSVELDIGEFQIAPVQTVSIQAYPTSGEVVGVTIGDQSARTDTKWIKQMRLMERRVGVLERRGAATPP